MQKVLAVVGSYRKGRAMDQLTDWVLEGASQKATDLEAEKIYLTDQRIAYCRNCMVCRNEDPEKPIAACVMDDDMNTLLPKIVAADALIFGTPVNMGQATAIMKTFLERACWTLARPAEGKLFSGFPTPRAKNKRNAVLLVSSGVVPPCLRWFCDDATSLLRSCCSCMFGARVAGRLYAGAVERRGVGHYRERALALGRRLIS